MNNHLISQFIDDELSLEEKKYFTKAVSENSDFKYETLVLLEQEEILQHTLQYGVPGKIHHKAIKYSVPWGERWIRPATLFSTGLLLGVLILFLVPLQKEVSTVDTSVNNTIPHRFVIYRPMAKEAKIVGSFTNWKAVSMHKIGNSGYWSLNLNITEGEHQYSYFVEDNQQITDPTVLESVKDDFGGHNSIITIKV
jgi:hypothetical protein